MTDITGISQAFAAALGMSPGFWGYILGTVVIILGLVGLVWAVGDNPMVVLINTAVLLALTVLIGWIDWWVVVFVFVIAVVALVFGSGSVPMPGLRRSGGGV